MFQFPAPIGRLLLVALCATITVVSRDAVEARASSVSVNIIEPTDEPDDYAYDQSTITIAAGDTVTWLNKGLESHTVTADNGVFDSKDVDPGLSWAYTFAQPGRFTYYCDPHPWMQGTIVVQPTS